MNKKPTVPAPSKLNLLRQICNLIPEFLVSKIAHETKADEKARTFTPWSHVVSLLYAQLTHSIGLNDVCDALQLHSGPLSSIRGATPPSRNNLSHADKTRPAEMAEKLFWAVLEHLGNLSPQFVSGKAAKRFARKFNRTIHLVDSTTIPLIASCMDWARHRRRKAAAKCHLRLDLQSFLPRFALVDTARDADAKRAREVCAGIKAGEMDKNVDPASTMQVVNALVKADKDFELLIVPGAGHGVARTPYGGLFRAHAAIRPGPKSISMKRPPLFAAGCLSLSPARRGLGHNFQSGASCLLETRRLVPP